jgi:hypothetical protein
MAELWAETSWTLKQFIRTTLSLLSLALVASVSRAQTSVSIHDIMTSLPISPYLGKSVSTSGIVVGVMSTGGFYISESSGSWDNLVSTAEGLPVFYTAGANPTCAVVGNTVTVVGTVTNTTAVTAANTPGTGITPTSCTVTATGGTMTQSISVSSVLTSFGDALKYTGMTTSATFYAVSPTGGTLDESTETITSNGQFWATLNSNTSTNNHLFRSTGIAGDEYVPSGAPSTVATWGGNPQRILIDTTTFGGTAVNITVGQSITCTTGSNITVGATAGIGLIDYTLGYARLLIFPTSVCTVNGSVATTTSATADSTHFQVGTLDLNRFYSTTGATTGSVAISSSAYTRRLTKAALAIVNSLGTPDILSVQEVQDQTTLDDLASAVNTLGSTSYKGYLVQSSDSNSLNLGFLVNTSRIDVDSVTQMGASATYSGGTLFERPPLMLKAEVHRVGKTYPVTAINVHLTSRDNIGDSSLGTDVRARRAAQAYYVSQLVQTEQTAGENVLVNGNFNATEFNDGYVDVLGVITGSPAAATAVTLYQASATTGALTNFTTDVTTLQRYNAITRGQTEAVEHILASSTVTASTTAQNSLASYMTSVVQPHFTADFAAVNTNSSTTPAGLTPHDGQVVSFLIPAVPTSAAVSATSLNFGDVYVGGSKSLSVTVQNTSGFTSTVNVTNIAISGTNASDYTQTSNCSALSDQQTCTITVTFAPTATGTRTGTLTITNDSTNEPSLTVALTGNGLPTTATLSPTSAAYGNVILNTTSATQTFTWTNTSAIALKVSAATVTSGWTVVTNNCGTVAAAASCTILVAFTPTTLGTQTGTLTVTSTSSVNGTLTASLSGRGVADVEASPTSLNFGNVDMGYSAAAQTVTITNYTNATIALTSITITGDYAYTSACSGTLAGLASCALSVTFTPTTTGARTGMLTVNTNDTKVPVIAVPLTGNGVDFSIALNPTSGSVVAGYSLSTTATLTPIGGFNNSITLSYSTTAGGTALSFASSTLTLSAATTDAVTITTTSQYAVIGYGGLGQWMSIFGAAAGLLLWFARRRVKGLARAGALFGLALFFLLPLSGCSGKLPSKNSDPTYPGTYTVTVTATDGTLTRSAAYTMTVTAK